MEYLRKIAHKSILAGAKSDPRTGAFLRSLLRCYLAGSCYNTRGMMNIGLVYAMLPGLAAIHTDTAELKSAIKRYVKHYSTHPFWLPCLVGVFLSAEMRIAKGTFPREMLEKIKNPTSYTLSAIGDSVFAGSLLIFWALASVCLLVAGFRLLPFAFGALLFVGLQLFRVYTFWSGIRKGFSFLEKLKRWGLIDWGARIKFLNSLLLLFLWYLLWPKPIVWWQWLLVLVGMGLVGRLIRTTGIPREIPAALMLLGVAYYPQISHWLGLF